MGEKSEIIKKNYAERNQKNKKVVFAFKIVVYVLTSLLLIDMAVWFIVGVMMEKHNIFVEGFAMPIGIILFGGIGLSLVIMNPRSSATANTKGDKIELAISSVIIIVGLALLIYNLTTL